jgi:hypothetical protein
LWFLLFYLKQQSNKVLFSLSKRTAAGTIMDKGFSSNTSLFVYEDPPSYSNVGAKGKVRPEELVASLASVMLKQKSSPPKVEDKENINPMTGLHAHQLRFLQKNATGRGDGGGVGDKDNTLGDENAHYSNKNVLTQRKPDKTTSYANGLGTVASRLNSFDSEFSEVGGVVKSKSYRYR